MAAAFQSWKAEGMLPGNPPVPEGVVVRAFLRLLGEARQRAMDCWVMDPGASLIRDTAIRATHSVSLLVPL